MRFTGTRAVVQLHPTRRCNLACLHCYSDSGPWARDELPDAVVDDLLGDAAALGYEVLAVSGGEPFLYRRLPELLRRAGALGLRTTVTTNGTLLGRRRLDDLAGALDLLVISLDGPPADHDRMRARDGAYAAMTRRVAAVRETGIPFGFLFTLTQHNVHQLEWAADVAVAAGASLLQVHPLEPAGRGRRLDAVPDAVESGYALLEVARLGRRHRDRLRLQLDLAASGAVAELLSRAECHGGRLGEVLSPLVVEPDGHCGPLQYGFPRRFALGNLHESRLPGLAEAWMRDTLPELRELVRGVGRGLADPGTPPVVNAYDLLVRAALAGSAAP